MLQPLKDSDRYHYESVRRRQAIRRMVSIPLVVIALIGVPALGYAWYQAQQSEVSAEPVVKPASTKSPISPTEPPKNAKVGISVGSFVSPVRSGQNSSISIKTLPGAACSISYTYNADKKVSKDTGLTPKVADEFGVASWTWTVTTDTRPGAWPVEITCARNGSSAYSKSDLVIL